MFKPNKLMFLSTVLFLACSLEPDGRSSRPETEPVEVGPTNGLGKADGFDWGSGCSGGSGTFNQAIAKDAVVTVGTIPKDKANVEIKLTCPEDVDIQLFDEDGTKIVQWPDGLLNEAEEETKDYNGVRITYSGYNGDGSNVGHEFIRLEGVLPNGFVMKAYGYAAGQARIDYSWEAKPGCVNSGSGSFEQAITKEAVVKVGDIIKDLKNVKVKLTSPVDIDIQLYDGSTKVVHWSDGILKGDTKVTKTYQSMKITWSGYNGDGTGAGNEYIEIEGETTRKLTLKVYGYEAGTATVNYSWGDDAGDEYAFIVLGDNRGSTATYKTMMSSIVQLDPKAIAVFNGGDITSHGKSYQWDEHHQVVAEGSGGKVRTDLSDWSSSYIRYIGVVGNHDTIGTDWYQNWNDYLPGQKNLGVNDTDGIYFSLTYKNALFIVLDSDHPSAAQTAWLKATLQSQAAQQAGWKFVFFHHPIYVCNTKQPLATGVPWARLLEQYKVDVAFVAHSHTYERTCAMVKGKCKAGGVVYVNASSAGAPRRDIDADREATVGTDSYHCAAKNGDPGILEKGFGRWHHYCRVAIKGNTFTQRCYDHDKTTSPKDTFSITKSN